MNTRLTATPLKTIVIVGLALSLGAGLTGCLGKTPQQTAFMKSTGGVDMNAEELRLRMRDGAQVYAGVVEDAANEIMARSEDPSIRRYALMWKARAIPAAQQALFQTDPLIALIDIWAFTIQMLHFFEDGAGKDAFGANQYIAIDAVVHMEDAILGVAKLAARRTESLPEVRESIAQFARDYPIDSWTFNRDSVPAHMEAFERAQAAGGLAAAGSISTGMNDLSVRLGLYAGEVPRRIMWESELLADTYITRAEVDQTLSDLTDIPLAVDNLRFFAEESVDELMKEKDALLGQLEGEVGSLGELYLGTLAFVRTERMAITADLQAERAIAMETLQAEREIALAALHDQRSLLMEEVTELSDQTMEHFGTRIEGVIDHFFLRLAQLLLVLVVICAIGGFFLVRALKS